MSALEPCVGWKNLTLRPCGLMCSRFPKHWTPACIVPSRRILSVPVALVRGGGFVLRPCYKSGDVGVLLYIDHDIDRIAASGEESEPNTERNHSDEDAVFIGAFVPSSNPLSGLPDNCLVMATEGGGIYVAVKQDKVEIKGDVEVQGKVKVRDDVIAKTVSLVSHKHTDSRNGNTSAPLP